MNIKNLSIFWQFVLLGIIVFFILGVFLSNLIAPTLFQFIFEQQKLNTVVFANRLANEFLKPEDFSNTVTQDNRDRFELFVNNLQIPGLFRVKIWNAEGRIIYSDKEELIGKEFPPSAGFIKALKLETDVHIESFDSQNPHYVYEAPFGEGLEIYAPITFGASSEVVGVIEIYARIGFLQKQIETIQKSFAIRVAISLFVMFIVLSFIVWRASRTVDQQRVKLQEYATGLEKMVQERTRKLEEITKKEIEQAKELLRIKDQFVFIIAHELRTPAAAIRWVLDTLKKNYVDFVAKEKTLFDMLYQSDLRLITLVDDFLEVARLEGKTIRIDLQPVSLIEIAKSTIQEVRSSAEKQSVIMNNTLPHDLPPILGDAAKLKEVFVNLLSNAIKYNTKNGVVTLSAEVHETDVVVHIADTGFGLSVENQKHVFEKFWRAEDTSQIEGTGLGLFIVKNLVELMSGKIWFVSELGKGTTFSFLLKRDGHEKR